MHVYTHGGIYYPGLILESPGCTYARANIDTIVVDTLTADFTAQPPRGCPPLEVTLTDISHGSIIDRDWKINGVTYSSGSAPQVWLTTPGNHYVSLTVRNTNGCYHSAFDTVTVCLRPTVTATGDTLTCAYDSVQLQATFDSSFVYEWLPSDGIVDPAAHAPIAMPAQTTSYKIIITDANGCKDTSNAHLVAVQETVVVNALADTTIALGDTAFLRSTVDQDVYGYEWTPANTLTCDTCPNPGAFPTDSTVYTLTVWDTLNCTAKTDQVTVDVIDYNIKVAMPDAFTPNGDQVNDFIYVKGENIKQLIYFRIYNRWGELIFETTNLNQGWDGTFKGVPQNIDTYAYVVKAISAYRDKENELRGNFSLIR